MKQDTAPAPAAHAPIERARLDAGTLLGWYTTADGRRRHVRLIGTQDYGLCVIDTADEAAVLVEPLLEDVDEARAIARDYLAVASECGEPQTRHPWPPVEAPAERSRS